jgi:ribonuclease G
VAAILIGGGGKPLRELETETDKLFHFQGTDGIPLDTFEIIAEGSREEIEDRALPFKQGEEVLIRIEEPHMYNVDDAIAKIDGYVISISGGGPFVGESKLIKIDEVRRTAAYASIVTSNGVPVADDEDEAEQEEPEEVPAPDRVAAEEAEADEAGEAAAPAGDGADRKLQSNGSSGRRRRGRRGGRRRSRASGGSSS